MLIGVANVSKITLCFLHYFIMIKQFKIMHNFFSNIISLCYLNIENTSYKFYNVPKGIIYLVYYFQTNFDARMIY